MSDYRLKVAVQNANILRAIGTAGFKSTAEMCRLFPELNPAYVAGLINFRHKPVAHSGELNVQAANLCLALGVLPEDLWTDEQLEMRLPRNTSIIDVPEDRLQAALDQLDAEKLVAKLSNNLTQKGHEILRLRYVDEHTLEESGEAMNVTRERVRQIEIESRRKMLKNAMKIAKQDIEARRYG